MNVRGPKQPFLKKAELIEALREDPQLLALADAVHATLGAAYRRRRARRRLGWLTLAASVLGAAAVISVVFLPAQSPDFSDRALAALGPGPVTHLTSVAPDSSVSLVNLRTGETRAETIRADVWYDRRQGILHLVARRSGETVLDLVAPPGRAIARVTHMSEPTSAFLRVVIAVAADYWSVVSLRRARIAGTGPVKGVRRGILLRLSTKYGVSVEAPLDLRTFLPSSIQQIDAGGKAVGPRWTISLAQVPRRAADFARTPQIKKSAVETIESVRIHANRAGYAIRKAPLWAGPRIAGLKLIAIDAERLVRNGSLIGGQRILIIRKGLRFVYESNRGGKPRSRRSFVQIREAGTPELAYGWSVAVPKGFVQVRRVQSPSRYAADWQGTLSVRDLYLTVTASSRQLLLRAARTLTPLNAASA